jgi:hypothetical protein
MPGQIAWVEKPGNPGRLALGREMMLIQGYPLAKVPKLIAATSDNVLSGIAGNAMATPIPLVILQAVFVALQWTGGPAVHTEQQDVDAAFAIFSNLGSSQETSHANGTKKRRVLKLPDKKQP